MSYARFTFNVTKTTRNRANANKNVKTTKMEGLQADAKKQHANECDIQTA